MKRLGMLFVAAAISCVLMLAQGCASGERTTSVTTVTRVNGGAANSQTVPGDQTGDPAMTDTNASSASTTTTTTTQSGEPDSVLGATLHLVGTIILAPFRIAGAVVTTIL